VKVRRVERCSGVRCAARGGRCGVGNCHPRAGRQQQQQQRS
jgi:hypothetical protein